MTMKSLFAVGDCLRFTGTDRAPIGNSIIAGRRFVQGEIHYTLFTDFGNTIVLSEKEVKEEFVKFNNTDLERWLIERRDLVNQQISDYMLQPWVFDNEQIKS